MNRDFNLIPFKKDLDIGIMANINMEDEKLNVRYEIVGDLSRITLPIKSNVPVRIYDLWEHTCFELFIKRKNQPWYYEYNFATNGNWNVFYISSYRVNEGEYKKIQNQEIITEITNNSIVLESIIDMSKLENLCSKDILEIGISSVIEDSNRNLSYYALVHNREEPDFHDGFMDFN